MRKGINFCSVGDNVCDCMEMTKFPLEIDMFLLFGNDMFSIGSDIVSLRNDMSLFGNDVSSFGKRLSFCLGLPCFCSVECSCEEMI